MARITKDLAHELIMFAKRIDIKANVTDVRSRSALEFQRQMSSPKLQKVNPSFECNVELHDREDPPRVIAEFVDGTKWEVDSSTLKAHELRAEFFLHAEDAEYAADQFDDTSVGDDTIGVTAAKKGGSKGGAKK